VFATSDVPVDELDTLTSVVLPVGGVVVLESVVFTVAVVTDTCVLPVVVLVQTVGTKHWTVLFEIHLI
jgi:hypothetical protein